MKSDTEYIGLYDCHCHILPGLDDGSRSLEETERLLRQEHAQGVRTVIATPHFRPSRWRQDTDRLHMALQQTRRLARQIDPQLRVYLWNEAYWEDGLIYHLKNGDCRTAGDGCVLVETRPDCSEDTLYQMARLLTANDYTPVFAHIERYRALRENRKMIDELREQGAWMQVNSDSIAGNNGFFTAMFCRRLLKERKIDLIGTDCHRVDFRPPNFRECVEYLRRHTGRDYFDWLMREQPWKLLKKEEYNAASTTTTML